jgi:hypothetical protein
MRGEGWGCGVSNEYICEHGALKNCGDLTSYFTYEYSIVQMQCWNVLGLHSSIIQHSGICWPFRRLNTNKTQKITPLSNKLCLINVGIPGVGKGNQQNICQAVGKSTYRIRPLGLPLLTIHIGQNEL